MYKTVRHGENSLQYTILPQTEEVLSNSGLRGKGRDYSPSVHARRRRRSPARCALLLGGALLAALLLAAVPVALLHGALLPRPSVSEPAAAAAPLTPTARDIVKSRKKELKLSPDIVTTLNSKFESTRMSSLPPATTTPPPATPADVVTSLVWTMPALRPWRSGAATTVPPLPTEGGEADAPRGTSSGIIALLDYMSVRPWDKDVIVRATTTPRPTAPPPRRTRPPLPTARLLDDVLITTRPSTAAAAAATTEISNQSFKDLKDTLLSVDDDDEFKESLEVDEVFSLPPLQPEGAAEGAGGAGDEVTVARAGGWYGARWPFVDTSSYFQWSGYSPGDNLLLPLLVAALSSLALVLLLALAVRRRKRTHAPANSIGLTTDMQADDNTNLLADTAEDAEE
ncbi:hypothetical protein JYU34_013548 [Plutella xylostella]|uniref:Uncharacterized protein n=1 Tax=Plutella xylostella TaxID=51655 RepID=A0ABQ7QB14_PLUXY|nr:hypothetical protein JYU34_013548 [Plutella xylostella]